MSISFLKNLKQCRYRVCLFLSVLSALSTAHIIEMFYLSLVFSWTQIFGFAEWNHKSSIAGQLCSVSKHPLITKEPPPGERVAANDCNIKSKVFLLENLNQTSGRTNCNYVLHEKEKSCSANISQMSESTQNQFWRFGKSIWNCRLWSYILITSVRWPSFS